MNHIRISPLPLLCLLSIAISASACTYRGSYEAIQQSNRQECGKVPPSQYDECLAEANRSFDEYQRQRDAEDKTGVIED